MKKYLAFAILLFFFTGGVIAQSHEQAINQRDTNKRKIGYWVIKNTDNKYPEYKSGQVVEEGRYKNSRKTGLWKAYHPNGKLKSEINYENGRPRGKYKLYYENGQLEESGTWGLTKNTGEFKRYYSNGQVMQDFKFTEAGLRTGEQKYYYENGNTRLEGTWQNGKESGLVKEYYENGELASEKQFHNGKLNKNNIAIYAPKKPNKDPQQKEIEGGEDMVVKADKGESPNQGGFDGNGYRKLYNSNYQIAKDGIFKNYRLMDGKFYKYDENGLLTQIMIFKNGKYVGDGVIEEAIQ